MTVDRIAPRNRDIRRGRGDTVLAVLAGLLLWGWWPPPAAAVDAHLTLKNRLHPLYLQNCRVYYATAYSAAAEAVILRSDQLKYESFRFADIRRLVFQEVTGYRNLHPVYRVVVYLREPGQGIEALLMPLRKLAGSHGGKAWEWDVRGDAEDDDKARQLRELVFQKP